MMIHELTQEHIGELADLMMSLPNRWGRTRAELDAGITASLARAVNLPAAAIGLGTATRKKHFTWIAKTEIR